MNSESAEPPHGAAPRPFNTTITNTWGGGGPALLLHADANKYTNERRRQTGGAGTLSSGSGTQKGTDRS